MDVAQTLDTVTPFPVTWKEENKKREIERYRDGESDKGVMRSERNRKVRKLAQHQAAKETAQGKITHRKQK